MLHSLQLNHFRGIESVSLDELAQVNLIVGGNNTGKTSILEALTLLYGDDQQLAALPETFRKSANNSDQWINFWPTLIRKENYDGFSIIGNPNDRLKGVSVFAIKDDPNNHSAFYRRHLGDELFGTIEDPEKQRSTPLISIRDSSNGTTSTKDCPNDLEKLAILSTTQADPKQTAALFNEIQFNQNNKAKLEELLREAIEPRLKFLTYGQRQGTSEHLIYVGLDSGPMIPFTQMGQAFARALHIYCEIFSQQPDILLIDEIENGLYYRGLEDFWKGLFAVLKNQNVQLFATTHSRECMEAAHKADSLTGIDSALCYIRLDRHIDDAERIISTSFDRLTMSQAIDFEEEMR